MLLSIRVQIDRGTIVSKAEKRIRKRKWLCSIPQTRLPSVAQHCFLPSRCEYYNDGSMVFGLEKIWLVDSGRI